MAEVIEVFQVTFLRVPTGDWDAELTSAVQLIVEAVLADDFVSALLEAAFAPVHVPPCHVGEEAACVEAGSVHLVEVFPAGRGQCRREYVETMLLGISCGTLQAETETHHAAGATFRFMLKTMYGVMPMSMVIAIIDDVQAGFFGVADALVQAFAVFAFWKDIRIAVENRRSNAMIYKAFYYG